MVGRVQVVHTLRPTAILLLAIDPGKILTAVHKTQLDKSVNVVRSGLFFFFPVLYFAVSPVAQW